MRDLLTCDLDLSLCPPTRHLKWGIVTEELLDGIGDQSRVESHLVQLFSIVQQRVEAIGEQARRRLMTGTDQKFTVGDDFGPCQLLAIERPDDATKEGV